MKKEVIDKKYWYICDFETNTMNTNFYKENQDFQVLAFSTRKWDNSEVVKGVSIEEWWNHLIGKKTNLNIFFHNLKFDGDFILKYWRKLGYEINNFGKADQSFKVFRNGMRIYYMQFFYYVEGEMITINIKCSFMMLSNSVDTLGKSLGIAKHLETDGSDFYDVEPQSDINLYPKRFVEYMENDTEIVRQSLINFEQMILNLPLIKHYTKRHEFDVFESITVSSLTKKLMSIYLKYYRAEANDKVDYLHISPDTYHKISPWFRGGWTQINDLYVGEPQSIGIGNMYDVKSAYPYQMTLELPYGELLEEEPDCNFIEFKTISVLSAKIKPKYNNFPILLNWKRDKTNCDQRYVRNLKNFICYYTDQEWNYITKIYDIEIEWESSYYMKTSPFLKDYALELYGQKEKFDKEGNKAFKQAAKILINAGYGCLAIREKFDSYLYIDNNILETLNRDDSFVVGKGRYKKNYNYLYTSELGKIDDTHRLGVFVDSKDKEELTNKAAAAVITSKQRCYLWNFIINAGVEHFCYSDTDSVLLGNVNDEVLDRIKKFEGKRLGDWEKENKQNIAYFGTWGAKKYILLDDNKEVVKLKWAGVSEKHAKLKEYWSDLALSADQILIENATLRAIYTKSGTGFELIKKEIHKRGI